MGAPKPAASTVALICSNFRKAGGQNIILSGGYDRDRAEEDLSGGSADLIAFGRPFIANPDLLARMRNRSPLAVADQNTFYTPGPAGYTDYQLMKRNL
jgi:N-ethylmaleimide reductase